MKICISPIIYFEIGGVHHWNNTAPAQKAKGGPVGKGESYLVGERGPELFTPHSSGRITPNNALGGATNISVNVDAGSSEVEGDESQAEQLGFAISAAIQDELVKQKMPGGLLYS